GFAGGFYFNQYKTVLPLGQDIINREADQPQGVDFTLFWKAWNVIQKKYVDQSKLNTQDLVYGAIDGLVKAVGDPYTVFFKPKESADFAQEINGAFGGIGIEIGLRNNLVTVIAPIEGTPAAKAGLLAGDKIIKIGDKSTEGMSINDAVSQIRGPKGTPVKLTTAREGVAAPKEYSIIRDTIKVPTVRWKIVDAETAYIQLFVFNRNLDADFEKTAKAITESRAKRIILDLRNNPGGLLDSAVNITSYFLDGDQIVTVEKFGDGKENDFRAAANGRLKNYPLVILINKGSASASEILAGALKDQRGITIIGEKSFGKGSVQQVEELPGKSSVKVTVAKWFTPKGTSINDNGIEPDIKVERT
ncbi:MAG: S41 family peptidase, partial [Patescibacteria group bacterium]